MDSGKTWLSKTLFSGPSAYSDMAILKTGEIGCLFEAGHVWPYQGIVFRIVSFEEIRWFKSDIFEVGKLNKTLTYNVILTKTKI